MSFLTARISGLTCLIGGTGAIATTVSWMTSCKKVILNNNEKQTCYKIFTNISAGEFFVCPKLEQGQQKPENPIFWLWWTKWGRRWRSYDLVKKIKVTKQADKNIKVDFPELKNKSLIMKHAYVKILGTKEDQLDQLNNIDLNKSCNSGKYEQELLQPQKYRVPQYLLT
ncbi:hypothetical protein OVS_04080 [Mycoplasma ovis str. Michigan]|uniref:Uncharacterized protein n=1 Tax=Mycoplasma ovis str. Michigan TaxID=1415773 RepID=A0ABM5P229_9MOLU|nr:hypothetical protein [Mycoplasma ovis]AHC40547.1 hypothetical protein OVS_04080 [Mycoplasma ovis str. Michigan]